MVHVPFPTYSRRVAEQIRIIFTLSHNLSAAQRHAQPNTEPGKVESSDITKAAGDPSTPGNRQETKRKSYCPHTISFTLRLSAIKIKAGVMDFITCKSGTAFGLQLAKH